MADEQPPDFIGMEGDSGIDWDMEEREFSAAGSSGKEMCSIVQKGCNMGKKLLITGLAISSAPVVLPPLVLMSAFVFAALIPYGVFLASYACTETFMSVWLPIPSPPERDGAYEEMVDENGYQEDLDEDDGEHGMETSKRGEVLDDLDIDVVVVRGDEEGKTDIGSGDQEAAIEVTSVEFEGNGDVGDDEEEHLKETRGFLKRIRDEGRREDDFGMENGAVDEPSDSVKENVHDSSAAAHPRAEYGTPEVSEEAELPTVTIIDVIETAADLSVSAVTIEPKVEVNAPNKDYGVTSIEKFSSEVKIREKIDSIKKIVGYKATPLETYIDEVNALYAFVGVEPPSPLKSASDDDDLNLVNQKLQFLMSIVGVK